MKILADPFFPEPVLSALLEAGVDAVHAVEIGASDLPMREFLRLAAFEKRIVVTRNRSLSRLVESDSSGWPSVIYFVSESIPDAHTSEILLGLLKLFDEDLEEGALLVVRGDRTELRKFVRR